MTVREKIMQGLIEALAYVKGDKSKGRTVYIDLPMRRWSRDSSTNRNNYYELVTTDRKIKIER